MVREILMAIIVDATENGQDWPVGIKKNSIYPDVRRYTTWPATVPAEEDYAWYSHFNLERLENGILNPRVAEVVAPSHFSAAVNIHVAISSAPLPLVATSRASRLVTSLPEFTFLCWLTTRECCNLL